MFTLASTLVLLVATTAPGDIADPRPGGHVVDLTGTLSASDVAAINEQAERGAGGGELMVVVVPTTSGMNPRSFTTTVFNRFGLDDRARDRGVMLLAAIKDRKAEIVVGDGFPDSVTQTTDSIMSGVVVARFKASDPRGAMLEGARAIVDRVLQSGSSAAPTSAREPADVRAPHGGPSVEVLAALGNPVVQGVPDPRARDGVVDGARLFGKNELRDIRAARVGADGIEVLLVTARETGGLSTGVFARALFHRLELAPDSKRGVLMVVIAPNATPKGGDAPPVAEVVLGDAFPQELADATATGVSAAWYVRVGNDPSKRGAATADAVRSLASLNAELERWQAEQARLEEEARQARMAEAKVRAQIAATQLDKSEHTARKPGQVPGGLLGLGVMALGLVGTGVGVREAVRRWPRKCRKCDVRMERLGEEVDDEHLSEGEKSEERLGSVNYDIWSCAECGDILKTRWGALITSFSTCGQCSFRTLSSTRHTITAATQYSTGVAEITERCGHCSFSRTYRRTIPRRPKPSSRSSSGGSSGRSSRGSSSGRGSSGSW